MLFDIGEIDLLEYELRNTSRALRSAENSPEFAGAVLAMVKDCLRSPDTSLLHAIQETAANDLQKMERKSSSNPPAGLRELNYWLQARLLGVPVWKYMEEYLPSSPNENRDATK